jgi:uncharacterized membrane protein YhaH (DUF805 family)
VRRFHDIGKSGWNYLFFAIPELVFFGYLIQYILISIKDLIDAGINPFNISDNTDTIGKIVANNIIANDALGSFVIPLIVLLVSIVLWLVWMTKDSQPGENKWGPNPKEVQQS